MNTQTCYLQKLQFLVSKNQFEELTNEDLTESIFLTLEHLKTLPPSENLLLVRKVLCMVLDQTSIRLGMATQKGFYTDYFQMLTEFPTRKDAFNYVNKHHEKIFGEKKYCNFKIFRKSLENLPYKYNKVNMNLERN